MKQRAFHHLTSGFSQEFSPYTPTQDEWWDRIERDRLPPRDIVSKISEASLSSMEARETFLYYIAQVRDNLKRRRRAGLRCRLGTKIIERLRHALDHWPDPRTLNVIELEQYKHDIIVKRPRTKKRATPSPALNKAA